MKSRGDDRTATCKTDAIDTQRRIPESDLFQIEVTRLKVADMQ